MASPNLLTIPPEIFDHVAAHLPLYATAPTLRSLILSNRHLFIHLHPLLYRHLTLACSPDYRYHRSLDVLLRLRNPETCLGHNVRALYLQCQVPTPQASLAGRLTVNSMTLLKDLILNGRLPYLQRLEIVYGYFRTPEITTRLSAVAISEVKAEAWDLVKDGCPELRTLTVSGWNGISTYDRSMRNQGVCASSFWKVESLSSLTLDCGRLESFKDARKGALVGCLTLIASRLEHLDVAINGSIEPFLKLTFPSITYLAFRAYTSRETEGFDVAIAMDFWKRHPLLESLSLRFAAVHDWMAQDIDSPVFSQDASTFHRLLPNLKHLSITSCDDWPWHSAGTQTLNLPLLKSLTVTSDRPEDMAGVVNTSPQLQELFWFALFPGRRLEGRLEVRIVSFHH
ncbi:hypothetical protein BKA70DRAFT_605100 [Coprinopsis sp. MPI-PUGE-AT-0042]|nr:hypothetical protein BKA70DRAFT_605100 [Coprinopsis sp. MPI-PUGE-AT-0042]